MSFNIVKHELWATGHDKHIEWDDGLKCWYDELGRLHRTDGAAIIFGNSKTRYYLHGIRYIDICSDAEWMIKLLLE